MDETTTEDQQTTEDEPNLGHLHGITGETFPPDIDGNHHRRYEWSAVGGEWWYEINIPKALGEYYSARYGRSPNFDTYVTDAYGDPYIGSFASEFEKMGKEYDLSPPEVVNLVVAFVQQLNYTEDEVTSGFDQYTSYPVETLINRGGDCEDSTILLAAILREMGYGCVLLGLHDAEPAHMALGVKGDSSIPGTYYEYDGDRYYYVETTGEGWQIGEMPDSIENTTAEIIEINRHPTLVYAYETSVEQPGSVVVNVAVRNFGKRTAYHPTFHVAFEDKSEEIHDQAQTQLGSLEYEDTETETWEMQPPEDKILRLKTAISLDNGIHDLDNSEWRRPV